MELTILPNEQTIIKDGVSLSITGISYPDCNAVQWHGDKGFYEFDSGNNMFTEQVEVQAFIDAFDTEYQKQNTEPEVNEWEEAVYSNGVWTVQDKGDALNIIKQVKCTEIDNERNNWQSQSLSYTFSDGTTGHIQRRNQKDERNIQGVASAAMSLVMTGDTTTKVHFTDEENVKHLMTGSKGMAFGVAVQENYATNQDNARQHKDAVNILGSVLDVKNYDYSTGWS